MKHLYISGLFILLAVNVYSQQDSLYRITRVQGIVVDGKVDEPVWDTIDPVPMVQYEPNAGAAPTEKTEIRFAYDDKYFYASMRAYDSNPNGIRATSLYRDQIAGSDHFEILLDTYNDNENGYIFTTTPTGIRNDLAIANDGTGGTISSGTWFNRDFNTFWDAEVTVTDQGWFAEIRIPFSSLRFQEVEGQVIMGLTVQRKVARKRERLVYPAVPPITDWAFLRPSLAQKIVLTGIKANKTVYVTPYILGGLKGWSELDQTETIYIRESEVQKKIGGDVKFSITNNLTADFTINTDFAQAEADDQLVNLTRFSIFYPEKRQFFQERASVFDFRTGGLSRLFFSRRIGLTDDGLPVPIYGGVRLIGRMKTWDIGLMDMQTQPLDSIPSENFGVLRLRRRVFNENSYAGGMFTSRMGVDGSQNVAYGIDGLIKVAGDDYLTVQWAQTFDNLPRLSNPIENFNSGRLALEMNRRRRSGFGYNVGTILSGSNYNPGVGFVDRNDFKYGTAAVNNTWFLKEGAPLIWHQLQLEGNTYINNRGQEVLSAEAGPEWSFSARNLDNGGVKVKWTYENLLEDFPLSGNTSVPVGQYNFIRVIGQYNMAYDKTVRVGGTVSTGTFYDGFLNSFSINPAWYASKHIQLNMEYSFNRGDFLDRNESFVIHISRLRINTAINRKISTNALIQYSSESDLFSANIRFRYNFREGQDLWIVLNEGLNTDRFETVPLLPVSASESILIKYLHTFIF